MLPYLRSFNLVEVDGPPVQYMVNVTDRTDRLVVTLCNNSPQPWEGSIRPRSGRVLYAENWMSGNRLSGGDGVRISVAPLDIVTVELIMDKPVFEVKR
jgi:hypothetical protein